MSIHRLPKARRLAALSCCLFLLVTPACSWDRPTTRATITADPNPVLDDAAPGTTTVTWSTGDGSWGQVYLIVGGQPAVLFVEGPSGSRQAPWISAGPVYEFRLYAGRTHGRLLAVVAVTGGTPPDKRAVGLFVLWHYAALTGLVLLVYGLGRILTRWCEYPSAWEQFVFCTGAGLGGTALVVFLLGILGGISRTVVGTAIILLIVACYTVWKELLRAALRIPLRTWRYGLLAAAVAVAVLLPVLLVPMYPPTAFDAIMYHLPYARSYVDGHAVRPLQSARFPVFPQVNEMLFTLALLFTDDVSAQMIQFLMMVLVSLTIYAWGSRCYSPRAGLWAACLWLSNPIVIRLAGYAFIDLGLTFFATLGAFALLGGLPRNGYHASILAGVFAGLAAGAKYSGLFFVAALGLATIALAVRERRPRLVAGFALAAFVTGAPWYGYNAYHSGNPIFPFLPSFFPTAVWAKETTLYVTNIVGVSGSGDSSRSLLGLPWSLSFGNFPENGQISPIYFAALPVLLVVAGRARARAVILLSVGFILFWYWTVPVVRYLMPILPVFGLAIAVVFDRILRRLPLPPEAHGVVTGALTLLLVLPAWQSAARTVGDAGLPQVTQQGRDNYLGRRLVSYGAYRFANRAKGSNYTLYGLYSEDMLYYAKGRPMGDWLGPGRFSTIEQKLSTGQELYVELRRLGANYFLVRTDRWPVKLPGDEFFRTHFKLVHSERFAQLFEIVDNP